MESTQLEKMIIEWLICMKSSKKLYNTWTGGQDMFSLFCVYHSLENNSVFTYQGFLKKLNIVETYTSFLYKSVKRDTPCNRLYFYFISNSVPLSPPAIRRTTHNNDTFHPQSVTATNLAIDTLQSTVSPTDNILDGHISSITNISEVSILNVTVLPINNSNTQHKCSQTSVITDSIDEYPILKKFGISTDLSNTSNLSTFQSILMEIEKMGKKYPLSFSRLNNTIAKPFFIPSGISSKKSFDQWEKRGMGFDYMLEFMSNNNINEDTNDPNCVTYLLHHLYKSYPKSFTKMINCQGFTKHHRMSVVETAAVLSDVGVGDKTIMNTLQKHLKVKFNGNEIFCPRRDLNKLTSRIPRLISSKTLFEKEPGIKKEMVGVAYMDTIEGIQLDMERFIHAKYISKDIFKQTLSSIPLFQTKTPTDNDGTFVLVGTDHGQGTAQFQLRILLGDSKERRLHNRPDFNSRTITYATIKCKKDPYEILILTKEVTNNFITHLRSHKIIALTDESMSTVRCLYVNKLLSNYSIQGNSFVASGHGIVERYEIPTILGNSIKFRVLIDSFYIIQVGDLLAQMTLQGREGMAACRCIKCDLTKTEWQNGLNHTLLNKEDLVHSVPNHHVGQRHPIIWNIPPIDTVVPILHCEMGTVNDQLYKKLFRQILCLDVGSEEELNKRTLILDLKDSLTQLEETKNNFETNLAMVKYHLSENRLDLVRRKKNATNRLKNAKRNVRVTGNDTIRSLELLIQTLTADIKAIDGELLEKKREYDSLCKQIEADYKVLQKAELDVRNIQWIKRTQEVSIHTKIERILESHGVTIQAYHGGSLTGGSILILLQKHQAIMDDITKVCHESILNPNNQSNNIDGTMTIDCINQILDEHRRLFKAQDAVYGHLRLIDPTEKEMTETVERIKIMKILWLGMGLSETPKAHLIFAHAADDQRRFGGLGDKIEDPLEKRHQEQLRLDAILKRMTGGFEQQMLTQHKYDWRNNHPLVTDQIELIKSRTARKRAINQLSLAVERSRVLSAERHQVRSTNINDMKQTLI